MSAVHPNFIDYYVFLHLRRRTTSAFVWTLLVLPLGLFALVLISAIQPTSPNLWFTKCFWLLFSFKFWVFCLIVILSAFPLFSQNTSKFSVVPHLMTRRVDHILFFFHPTNTILGCCYFIFSVVTSSVLLSLIQGVNAFDKNYLDSSGWDPLLVLNTSLILACYLPYHFNQKRAYQFQAPLIPLSILARAKMSLRTLLFSSLKTSFWLSLLVHLFNHFIAYPRARSNSVLKFLISHEMDHGSMSLTNMQMIYNQFVMVLVSHFFLGLHLSLHNIFHTQPLEFPIVAKHPNEGNKCLSNALSCAEHPLLQHLAFLDLFRLSQYDKKRRLDLYSLSTPGHHPVYWKAITNECFTQLDKYVSSLTSHIYSVLDGTYALTSTNDTFISKNSDLQHFRSGTTSSANHNNSSILSPLKSPSLSSAPCYQPSFLNSSTVTPPRTGISRLRPASLAQPAQNTSAFLSSCGQPHKSYVYSKVEKSPSIFDKSLKSIKQSKPISYFFSELVERKNRKMFVDAQKYIWLVQGLSSLALHSYEEDQYGVVQNSLPALINSLLAFYEILSKPLPLSASGKKGSTYESKLKTLLKSEVKSAIYKIVITFRNGLSSLEVSPEHWNKLNLFKELKE